MIRSGIALNEIIVRVLYKMQECKEKLETEESGRIVAKLQGMVGGCKKFLSYAAAEFHLNQIMLEYNGDAPEKEFHKLDPIILEGYRMDIERLVLTEEWVNVLARIEANTLDLKNHLLFGAKASRELDLAQGEYDATVLYQDFLNDVSGEVRSRQREQEERKKNPELSFDLDGEPGAD